MAEVEFHLHNEVGIKFPPLRPAYSEGDVFFERFRCLVARSTGSSIIGEGGTGRIHLVRDELMEREVALKIPLDSILRDPAAREDIIQETRQAMDLTHPNIVRIHDFHEGGGKWGISMQYVRGKNLDEWRYDSESTGFRRAIRPYTVEAISDWTAQLCDALRYAHEDARMVHRDIKPKNLMLEKRDGGEKVYITDFGISQRLRQHTMMLSRDQSKAGESKGNMGTLPYMPWEQISGAPASPLDDIYAVGATIYELITGRPPFYDGGFEQIKVQIREMVPPSMEKRILDLGLHMPPPPDEWEEVVAACLAKKAEDRPQSMRAVAAALGFQSGSNTELEAKVSIQAERLNELETQIIQLSTATAPVDREAEAQLHEARQQIATLQQEISQAQDSIKRLEEMLQATAAERDTALQGGDAALKTFQADATKKFALAEDKLAKLQQELDAAKSGGDVQVQQAQQAAQQKITELEAKLQAVRKESDERLQAARKEAEQGLQAVRKESEQGMQTARKEAEQGVQAATEKLRREAEQIAERLKKTEEAKEKAINQAREEGEKRLQKQAEELEKTRQSLSKVVQQKEQLEREVATEKERQGASLRPLLVSLIIAMALGLGGGFAASWWKHRQNSPDAGLSGSQIKDLPTAEKPVADTPVRFALFEQFAKSIGTTVDELGAVAGNDGAVYGVSAITALNFCNWLTKKDKSLGLYHYTLPEINDLKDLKDLKGKVAAGKKEWSKSWADNKGNDSDLLFKMLGSKGDTDVYNTHPMHADPSFTFRIKREKIPAGK
jgi:serine/threonine protein kinase